MQRTWTATIEVREGRTVGTLEASTSQYDLLKDQTEAAVREAALFVTETSEVHVQIFKTTQARGTEKDRSFFVFRGRDGAVRYAR